MYVPHCNCRQRLGHEFVEWGWRAPFPRRRARHAKAFVPFLHPLAVRLQEFEAQLALTYALNEFKRRYISFTVVCANDQMTSMCRFSTLQSAY